MSPNQYFPLKEVEIPPVFKTSVSEENFSTCISCEKNLLENETEYVIEKIYQNSNVEIEYAMCIECVEETRKNFSEESLHRLNEYFEKRTDSIFNHYNKLSTKNAEVNEYISNCIFNGKSVHQLKEYQLVAYCKGNKLLLSAAPYMVSGDIIEEVQELLSAKTKEELDRFMDKHFGLPPDLMEVIKNKKLIFF